MDGVSELIREYGLWIYLLLFAYCLLKSGSLPLFAGYAAQAQLLDLHIVVIATFAGGYLGDEVRFIVARRYGDAWAQKWRFVQKAISAANALTAKYGRAYIFIYRYPKGMRTVGALPVGLGSMPWAKFTIYNAASALIWTACLVTIGFVFGAQVEQAVASGWGAASVFLLVVMALVIMFAWWRINRLAGSTTKVGER